MSAARILLTALGAYLLGGVPFSLLLGYLCGVDIRKHGSGNVGATNLARVCGKWLFFPAFFLDFAKGFCPVTFLAPPAASSDHATLAARVTLALAPVLGHVFSPFLRFRGGKGVATGAGALAALVPVETAVTFGVWLLVLAFTRTVGVASAAASAFLPVVFFLLPGRSPAERTVLGGALIGLGLLVLWRHRSNLAAYFCGRRKQTAAGSQEKERS